MTRGQRIEATIASLIETCKLNAIDPLAYLTATLTAIVSGHKQSQINCWRRCGYRQAAQR